MAERVVRIFLDSNVIISGLLSENGAPRIILDLLCLHPPGVMGITGQFNLIEIERNLHKKFPRALPLYEEYLPKLALDVIELPSLQDLQPYTGRVVDKDLPVLVSAVLGLADFLVTGDNKNFGHLKDDHSLNFAVVTPAELLMEIGRLIS